MAYRAAAVAAGWVPGDDPREFVDPVEFTRVKWTDEDYERSPVKVSEAASTDVNRIMQLYDFDGLMRAYNGAPVEPIVDVSDFPSDYATAINQVRAADAAFMALPAKVREAFGNDAAKLLDAIGDPSQEGKLIELGVLPKKEAAGAPTPAAAPTQ